MSKEGEENKSSYSPISIACLSLGVRMKVEFVQTLWRRGKGKKDGRSLKIVVGEEYD